MIKNLVNKLPATENDSQLAKSWRYQREGETALKNSCVSAINFFNQRVVKNERDRINFQILYISGRFIFKVIKVLLMFMS